MEGSHGIIPARKTGPGGDDGELDAGILKEFLDPVLLRRLGSDQIDPVPRSRSGLGRRRAARPACVDAGEAEIIGH